ncbi:hypothetical protein LOS20_12350 [Enterococcus faecium]|nr:hypothetical protein [Enterococcus faecium]
MYPADGRLLDAGSLKVDEGMLTGESTASEKEVTDISQDGTNRRSYQHGIQWNDRNLRTR